MIKKKTKLIIIILIIVILVSIPVSMMFGSSNIDIRDVITVMLSKVNPERFVPEEKVHDTIVWSLRLPRILLAIAVGTGLSVSGVSMQSITRNVMAEPYTLGVASGAAAFAALYISRLEGDVSVPFGVNAFAFIGAMISMILIFVLSANKRFASNFRIILTGIVIGMIFNAIRQFIVSTTVNPNKVTNIEAWEMGALGAAQWSNIWIPVGIAAGGFVFIMLLGEKLNLLSMGEQTATTLGVSIKKLQITLIIITSLLTGVMVASSGIISFVGLIVPHIVRRIVGSNNLKVLPVSALGGAVLIIWTDVVARTIVAPEELAISVITALIGGPLLIFLIRKDMK